MNRSALALLLVACGQAPSDRAFMVLLESAPYEIDPRVAGATHGLKIGQLIFCGLTRVNERLEIVPDLAQRWEIGDGGRVYTFFLRRGVRFHDGTPLTARDVKFTYDTLLDARFGSRYAGVFRDKIHSVDALDDMTVRFRLHAPQAPFLADVTMGVVPAHVAGATREARVRFERRLVGTGPFKLAGRCGDDLVELSRNDEHHDGIAKLERLVFRVVRNEVTRYLELVKGDADLVQNALSPLYLPLLESNRDLRIAAAQSTILTYMLFNLRDAALGDVRVRRAIAHAIDRHAIVRAKMRGRADVARGVLSRVHPFAARDAKEIPFDQARARALLAEAGYGPSRRLRITYKTSTDRFRLSIARVIATQLREVGIDVDVRPYEFGTFFADLRKGAFQLISLQFPELDEPDALHSLFHSTRVPTPDNPHVPRALGASVGATALLRLATASATPHASFVPSLIAGIDQPSDGPNRERYLSPRVDWLLTAAQQEIDITHRRELYDAAEREIAADLPMLPLWHEHNIAITRAHVTGFNPQPNGKLFYALMGTARGARGEATR